MEKCQRCGEVDEDRRTLWMSCFYDMNELDIPFANEIVRPEKYDHDLRFHTLRVCKLCRARWMAMINTWFHMQDPKNESCGSGIFVRELGATIEITEEEWERRAPGVAPIRFHGEKA